MCKVDTPSYQQPPERARERKPDNAALYLAAQRRAAQTGGGSARSTVIGSLRGDTSMADTTRRTALG